jgi:hypothetical protein
MVIGEITSTAQRSNSLEKCAFQRFLKRKAQVVERHPPLLHTDIIAIKKDPENPGSQAADKVCKPWR